MVMKIDYSASYDPEFQQTIVHGICNVEGVLYTSEKIFCSYANVNENDAKEIIKQDLYKQIIKITFDVDQDGTLTGIGSCIIDGVEYKQYVVGKRRTEILQQLRQKIIEQIENNNNDNFIKFLENDTGTGTNLIEITGIAFVDGLQFKKTEIFDADALNWKNSTLRDYAHEIITNNINKQIEHEQLKYGDVKFTVVNNDSHSMLLKAYIDKQGFQKSVTETIYKFNNFDWNTIVQYTKLALCERLK